MRNYHKTYLVGSDSAVISEVVYDLGDLVVAVLGAEGYGASLGKKSTSTDITLYDLKKDEDIVTFIEPSRYPERLAPLFYATSMAKRAILVIDELNSTFGECTMMLECLRIEKGYIILRNYLPREKVEPLIRGTVLEKYEFTEDNPTALRIKLLNEVRQEKQTTTTAEASATGTVPVDHAFNVKGVGVVVLGIVTRGTIEKHEVMKVFPGNKTIQIRSIQKHDDDVDKAVQGDRVGLALKNVDVEDLDRGTVLTSNTSIISTTSMKVQASLIKYWPSPIKNGMILHVGHWMQFIPGRVESTINNGDWRNPFLTITLEKELIHFPGDHAVIMYLDGGKLRIAGTVKLP